MTRCVVQPAEAHGCPAGADARDFRRYMKNPRLRTGRQRQHQIDRCRPCQHAPADIEERTAYT